MNLEVAEKTHVTGRGVLCPRDGYVVFRNSDLVCGRLGKATLGGGNKAGLFQVRKHSFPGYHLPFKVPLLPINSGPGGRF